MKAKKIVADFTTVQTRLTEALTVPAENDYAESKYVSLIVEKLKTIHPYKVILFGSYAYGM